MRTLTILGLVTASIAFAACSYQAAPAPPAGGAVSQSGARPALLDSSRPASTSAQEASSSAGKTANLTVDSAASTALSQSSVPRLDRMVIATANLHISADNAVTGAREAERVAYRYGGFVDSSSVKDLETGREAVLTLRIPVPSMADALNDIRAIGKKVTDETSSTQDVTEEFTDVESNIRNLRATEAQVLAFMERATKIDEILVLQRELTSIRGQIERLEGRRRVLDNRTSYATLSVRMTEPATIQPRPAWSLADTAVQAFTVLSRIGQGTATLMIWVLVFTPVWGVPALIGWWISRHRTTRTPTTASA